MDRLQSGQALAGSGDRRRSWVGAGLAALMVIMATVALPARPASAQVIDLACQATAFTPSPTTLFVQGTGHNGCGWSQKKIDVSVCLLLDGIPVRCGTESEMDSSSAQATVEFPCIPGIWSTVAIGTSTNGKASASASLPALVLPGDCNPLSPRP